MPSPRKYQWPNKLFFAAMLVLCGLDVARGRFPTQPVYFVIGSLLAPLVWPRFYRVQSTAWSFLGLILLGIAAFAASITIGSALRPLGEGVARHYSDGLHGLFLGLFLRAPLYKVAAEPEA